MYFRFAVVKLSLVVLGGFALIIAGLISPLPQNFTALQQGYEGPCLDHASGLIGINRGRGIFLSSWDGEVLWGRRLSAMPADPRPVKLPAAELFAWQEATGQKNEGSVSEGWAISHAVLCPEPLAGLPRLLALTRTRSFDDSGVSLPIQQVRAAIHDAESGALLAELELPVVYQELLGRQPEPPFSARLDCAAAGEDGLLVLNLFMSSGNAYSSSIGLWNEQGFTLLPLSGHDLAQSSLLCGPGGKTLWINEGHCEIFDAAGTRVPTADLASWHDARRRLRGRLITTLSVAALLAFAPTAALALLFSGRGRTA